MRVYYIICYLDRKYDIQYRDQLNIEINYKLLNIINIIDSLFRYWDINIYSDTNPSEKI